MKRYLLDVNVICEPLRPKANARVLDWLNASDESHWFVSVLTLGEIRQGVARLPPSKRRSRYEAWLETELPERLEGRILAVDAAIADEWGRLRGEAMAAGHTLPVIDSLLAATARVHDLILVTRNVRDIGTTGVKHLNPWEKSENSRP